MDTMPNKAEVAVGIDCHLCVLMFEQLQMQIREEEDEDFYMLCVTQVKDECTLQGGCRTEELDSRHTNLHAA